MNSRWLQIPFVAALGAIGALLLSPRSAPAQQTPALIRGGGSAGVEKEPTFRFATVGGGKASQADYDRNVFKVPAYYGECFAVTQAAQSPVLWYRTREGAVRNVILSDARMLVRVQVEGQGR